MNEKKEKLTFDNCPEILNIVQVAELLTISDRMVNKLVASDKIKSFRIGRCRRFTKGQVKEFVFNMTDDVNFMGLDDESKGNTPKNDIPMYPYKADGNKASNEAYM
ncbi:MAG: helix-turn-helix domain-containing protein [Bacilli bacterium]|jgi:excisionase family DNA binding protein|nr:helix-turn-helix domain-containing protein [Bacilli bacterium]MCI2110833.1 helix-turn-helix domain-containing protein [Bacilli bacterium]